jgi:hypothetical protein
MKRLSVAEYDRMWRVLDQSLSAHSILRDRYSRWERASTLLILTFSILATAGAFLSGASVIHVGLIKGHLATWLGILTTVIFFLTLIELITGWRRKAWEHEGAAGRLAGLKMKMRSATIIEKEVEADVDLRSLYEEVMAAVAPIPDRKFVAMKAKHHRKVAISKLIDTHVGAPVMYLRLLAVFRGLRASNTRDSSGRSSADSIEDPPV